MQSQKQKRNKTSVVMLNANAGFQRFFAKKKKEQDVNQYTVVTQSLSQTLHINLFHSFSWHLGIRYGNSLELKRWLSFCQNIEIVEQCYAELSKYIIHQPGNQSLDCSLLPTVTQSWFNLPCNLHNVKSKPFFRFHGCCAIKMVSLHVCLSQARHSATWGIWLYLLTTGEDIMQWSKDFFFFFFVVALKTLHGSLGKLMKCQALFSWSWRDCELGYT